MRVLSLALALFLFSSLQGMAADAADSSPAAKFVLWKFDDLRGGSANGVGAGFNRVVEWLKEKKMKASLGIICDSLEKPTPSYIAFIKGNAVENGGLIEFWNHGLNHSKKPVANAESEFKGTDLAFQAEHLAKASQLLKDLCGLTFHTFGSPYNEVDATTEQALSQNPDYQVWLYGLKPDGNEPGRPLALARTLNLEIATGKVSAEAFLGAYAKSPAHPYLLLQGHAGMWDEQSFKDFTVVADRLVADGWTFATPYEYYQIVRHRTGAK
jgi:peptidoglycan/xylan/chitin deacetylase (PgdA/CDA1 family)